MRIYTCYSDSHLPLVRDHLLPSVPPGFDLVLHHAYQSCPSGVYGTMGWGNAMSAKVGMILRALSVEKQPFIVSDADVRFYDLDEHEIVRELGDHTVTYQLDCPVCGDSPPSYCAGFAVIAPTKLAHELYAVVLDEIASTGKEQGALTGIAIPRMLLRHPGEFKIKYLPPDRFWNKTHKRSEKRLAMHHANWVVGIDAKWAALEDMRKSERKKILDTCF